MKLFFLSHSLVSFCGVLFGLSAIVSRFPVRFFNCHGRALYTVRRKNVCFCLKFCSPSVSIEMLSVAAFRWRRTVDCIWQFDSNLFSQPSVIIAAAIVVVIRWSPSLSCCAHVDGGGGGPLSRRVDNVPTTGFWHGFVLRRPLFRSWNFSNSDWQNFRTH